MRRLAALTPIGSVVATAGLVLLVLEAARALNGNPLGTLGTVLLWVGLGLLAIGSTTLVVAASSSESSAPDLAMATPTADSSADKVEPPVKRTRAPAKRSTAKPAAASTKRAPSEPAPTERVVTADVSDPGVDDDAEL